MLFTENLEELYNASLRIGLKKNMSKTRIVANFRSVVNIPHNLFQKYILSKQTTTTILHIYGTVVLSNTNEGSFTDYRGFIASRAAAEARVAAKPDARLLGPSDG